MSWSGWGGVVAVEGSAARWGRPSTGSWVFLKVSVHPHGFLTALS